MSNAGIAYLKKFSVLEEDSTKNYICYLLPFWVKELTGITNEEARKLSLANVFIMLYFFIQDDLMDTAPVEWKQQLALGNLFYLEFLEIYRDEFPSDSPFWLYFRTYITEWADSVTNENDQDYFKHQPTRVATKASPLKLASTGALLLSNKADTIDIVTDFIDHVLVTLQMVDDWVDWQDDLEEGSYNCLLSMIKLELQREHEQPVTID
jgi:hypothetical protein